MGGNNEAGPGLVSQEAARLYDAAESFEAVDAAAHRALEYGFDSELAERVRELFRNRLQEVNEYLAAHRPEFRGGETEVQAPTGRSVLLPRSQQGGDVVEAVHSGRVDFDRHPTEATGIGLTAALRCAP